MCFEIVNSFCFDFFEGVKPNIIEVICMAVPHMFHIADYIVYIVALQRHYIIYFIEIDISMNINIQY